MKKVTKQSLDELARTMTVIPSHELLNFVGGAFTYYFATINELTSFLSSWTMQGDEYVEAMFFQFEDGSYAVHVSDKNTGYHSSYSYTRGDDGSSIYFSGNRIVSVGHTHRYDTDLSDQDIITMNNGNNIGRYIYYNGLYYDMYSLPQ